MALQFSPAADEALDRLYAQDEPVAMALCNRLEAWLDLLEQDSGSSRVRQRRFASVGLWAITVQERLGTDWLILWEPAGSDAVIRYIGPASFT